MTFPFSHVFFFGQEDSSLKQMQKEMDFFLLYGGNIRQLRE